MTAKKAFTDACAVTAVLYGFVLYYMLFRMPGRGMVLMSENMLKITAIGTPLT